MHKESPRMAERATVTELAFISEATGLPPRYLTPEFVRSYMVSCIAATFSDGELVVTRPPEKDSAIREHFGVTRFDEGTFGARLRELLEGEENEVRRQTERLIRWAAGTYAHDVANGKTRLEVGETVAIHTAASQPVLAFDAQRVILARPPEVVVDYGPGLAGRFHIERQLADIQEGRMPYAHIALSRGPFINEFLRHYWVARLRGDLQRWQSVEGALYVGREDGMAAATTELVNVQRRDFGTAEVADVVIASGIYAAGYEAVQAGITNAYQLLHPGGALLVRAPKAVYIGTSGGVPAEDMVDMALQAGFSGAKARYFPVVTGDGFGGHGASLTAVFRK